MKTKIIFLYYKVQFVEYTLGFALSNIAAMHNIEYEECHYNDGEKHLNIEIRPDYKYIVCFIYDPNRSEITLKQLKRQQNVRLVQFGGDVHYYRVDPNHFKHVHLHIDTMLRVQEEIEELGTSYAHYYWSISQKMIDMIKPDKVEKTHDLICLCRNNTQYRNKFFKDIGNKYALKINLNEYDYDKIVEHYKSSLICLGTSSPCTNYWHKRSMKGFRDWIAPFCDTVLIYDDINEIRLTDVVPMYKYDDMESLFGLIEEMKNDADKRSFYIEKQKHWAVNNTIDNQLTNILRNKNIL